MLINSAKETILRARTSLPRGRCVSVLGLAISCLGPIISSAVAGAEPTHSLYDSPWPAADGLTTDGALQTIGAFAGVTALGSSGQELSNLVSTSPRMPLAEMDKVLGIKGWYYSPPSFVESVTADYGGWRSTLASFGIGLIEYNVTRFQVNLLDTPREGPRYNPFYESRQSYWGQKPSFHDISALALTYDLSRFGIPDGQFQSPANVKLRHL